MLSVQVESNTIPGSGAFGGGSGGSISPGFGVLGQALVFAAYYGLAIGLIVSDGPLPGGDAAAVGLMYRASQLRRASRASEKGWKTVVGVGMLAVPDIVLVPIGTQVGEFLETAFGSTGGGSHNMWVGPEVVWFYE